jgi:hypothetical protein
VRNYRWYMGHRDQYRNVTGITHRAPWKQKALKMVKVFF